MAWYTCSPDRIQYYFVTTVSYKSGQFEKHTKTDESTGITYDVDLKCLEEVTGKRVYGEQSERKGTVYLNNQELQKFYDTLAKDQFVGVEAVFFIFLTFLGEQQDKEQQDTEQTVIIGPNSGAVNIDDIIEKVKRHERLFGIPKVFLIQADDTKLMPDAAREKGGPLPPRRPMKIPLDADRLVIRSTIPQKWAECHPDWKQDEVRPRTSFLIRAFCDEVEANRGRGDAEQLDLLSLTTNINNRVHEMIEECKNNHVVKGNTNMSDILSNFKYPMCESTFTRFLRF